MCSLKNQNRMFCWNPLNFLRKPILDNECKTQSREAKMKTPVCTLETKWVSYFSFSFPFLFFLFIFFFKETLLENSAGLGGGDEMGIGRVLTTFYFFMVHISTTGSKALTINYSCG